MGHNGATEFSRPLVPTIPVQTRPHSHQRYGFSVSGHRPADGRFRKMALTFWTSHIIYLSNSTGGTKNGPNDDDDIRRLGRSVGCERRCSRHSKAQDTRSATPTPTTTSNTATFASIGAPHSHEVVISRYAEIITRHDKAGLPISLVKDCF